MENYFKIIVQRWYILYCTFIYLQKLLYTA